MKSAVRFEPAVVALCAGCDTYVDASDAGKPCPMTGCETKAGSPRRTRRRSGYICLDCENRPFFPGVLDLENHAERHRLGWV